MNAAKNAVWFAKSAKFSKTHTLIGERVQKNRRGIVVARIPVYRYVGWEHGHRYTGAALRDIRKINGVGRPPSVSR